MPWIIFVIVIAGSHVTTDTIEVSREELCFRGAEILNANPNVNAYCIQRKLSP